MRYEKASQNKEMQVSPLEVMWPNWNKQQILGWKWCSQEPQAHITSPFKHFYFFSFFFQSCWLEVSNIFWPSNFTPFLLVSTGAVILSPPLARGAAECSQDTIDEDGHDGGTDQTRDGHSHKPRHEDVSEQTPVYGLPWAQPSYCNHRAHLETQQLSDESHHLP